MPVQPDCKPCTALGAACWSHRTIEEISSVDDLWSAIHGWLNTHAVDNDERWRLRRFLRRRLLHPELENSENYLEVRQRQLEREAAVRPKPRYDSPLCICGARRRQHAEDGSFSPNGCDMFTPS